MSATAEKILTEAMTMPTPVRAYMAEKLLESLDNDDHSKLSPEWDAEITKRCKEIDEGLVEMLDFDAVIDGALHSI